MLSLTAEEASSSGTAEYHSGATITMKEHLF